MTLLGLLSAIRSLLETDRDANQSAWPTGCLVKTDPRVLFWDDVAQPEIRISHDPNEIELEALGQGRQRRMTVKVEIGLSRRIEDSSQYDQFIEWGQYLFDLLNRQTTLENWTLAPPGEWGYTHDPDSLQTGATGEVTGRGLGLFLLTWTCVRV